MTESLLYAARVNTSALPRQTDSVTKGRGPEPVPKNLFMNKRG